LARCEAASRRECPDAAKARLLRDLGIVQAGAYRDHQAAVAAFVEARRLDPNVSIPPDLLVERVRQAFIEAGGEIAPPPVSAPAPAASAAPTPVAVPPREPPYQAGDTFVMVVGTWGGGGDMSGSFMGEWGGAVSGAWHITGPLAVGARISAGGTTETDYDSYGAAVGPYGILGAAALIGVMPRGKRNTGYFLLGIGPDYVPEVDRARMVVSLASGVSFGGFTFGGMPAVTFNNGHTGGAIWFFVGWGNYVKD